ncbi:VTT domain-containing protein [Methanolobus sp.]|uniref:VTT domain-containing protein n=1 Tax=Methanolobus sp. TaxID=1874737 RepID=UPI0035225839
MLSKMIPIVSETMACFAGLTGISWRKFIILSLLGIIPVSVYYAYVGRTSENFLSGYSHCFLGLQYP